MKYYTAELVIKEKGTKNKVRLKSKRFSEQAVDELQTLFVQEMVYDPSHQAKTEMLEGLKLARISLREQAAAEKAPREDLSNG